MNNKQRSKAAALALAGFALKQGQDMREEAADVLSDLLANLMHWADEKGHDFNDELRRARGNYAAERAEEGQPPSQGTPAADAEALSSTPTPASPRALHVRTIAEVKAARDLIAEAITAHVYDVDNGETIPPDCAYTATVQSLAALAADLEAEPCPTVYAYISGGVLQGMRATEAMDVRVCDYDEIEGGGINEATGEHYQDSDELERAKLDGMTAAEVEAVTVGVY